MDGALSVVASFLATLASWWIRVDGDILDRE